MKSFQLALCALLIVCITYPFANAKIPGVDETVDSLGVAIGTRGATYTLPVNKKLYHGSPIKFLVDGSRPFWVSPQTSNALAAGLKKATDDNHKMFFLYEYTSIKSVDFLALATDSKANADLLFDKKKPYFPDAQVFTMGNPSGNIVGRIPNSKLCKDFCGWRSPWDQDEFMFCPKCQKDVLELTAVYGCVPDGLKPQAIRVVKEDFRTGISDKGLREGYAVREGGLKTFDMQLEGGKTIENLVDDKICQLAWVKKEEPKKEEPKKEQPKKEQPKEINPEG